MDCNGLNGLCGNLGTLLDGEYQVADDCHGEYINQIAILLVIAVFNDNL